MSSTTQNPQAYQFIYNGVQYDATDYAKSHPGGLTFISNMRNITHDFTQYFRALHSDTAEKILKSLPIVGQHQPTKHSEVYNRLYQIMEPYFKPIWLMEFLLTALVIISWIIGLISPSWTVCIPLIAFSQILIGWISHSAAHSRDTKLNIFGRICASFLGGLSLQWWNPKHNMHHMFTNIQKYDEDIQHQYKVYLYPFLYLKWRADSLIHVIMKKNYIDFGLIVLHYALIAIFRVNLMYVALGLLIAGFYSAFVLIGNHQRQKRFPEIVNLPFVDHQIITCRNYHEENLFWLILMGGMQFQTQHHLFPQIPFYRLPEVKNIIRNYLAQQSKTIIYGSVL